MVVERLDRLCAAFARVDASVRYERPRAVRWLGAAFVILGLGLLVVPRALVAQPPPEYYAWLQYAVACPSRSFRWR